MVHSNIIHPAQFLSSDRQDWEVGSEASVRLLGLPSLASELIPDGSRKFCFPEIPDVIILTEPNSAQLLASRLAPSLSAILPVVDASCGQATNDVNRRRADLCAAVPSKGAIADALELLKRPIERVRSLASSVLQSADPRIQLLARLFVRDRGLEPRRDPNARGTVSYADGSAIACVQRRAEELAVLGLLERRFFDKLPHCPHCESARLSIREQCSACRSANIAEASILHHMRCAYQAPEQEFRAGRHLICPQCRGYLEHFGVDYDRPGFISICGGCGHASSDQSVGFVCLDCEAEGSAMELGFRIIHQYHLTEAGRECLQSGVVLPGWASQEKVIVDRIREFVNEHTALRSPCSVLAAKFRASQGQIVSSPSRRARALYASLMRETFTPETEIIEAPPWFFALLANDEKSQVEDALPDIRQALEQNFASPLDVDYRVYEPEEILGFLANVQSTRLCNRPTKGSD